MAAREGSTGLSMVCCTRGAADTLDAAERMRYFSCRRGRPCAFYSGRPRGGDGFGTDDQGLARGEGPWSVSGEAGLGVLVLAIKVVLEVLRLGCRALVGDWTPFAILALFLFAKIAKKKKGSYFKFCAPRDSTRLSHGLSASFTRPASSRRHRERRPGATDAFYYRLLVCFIFALNRGAPLYQWTAAQDTPLTAPVTAYAAPGGLLSAQQCTNAVIDPVAGRSWSHGAPSAPSLAAAEFNRSQTRDVSKKCRSARLARCVPPAFCEGLPFDDRPIPASARTSNTVSLRVGLAQDRVTTRRSQSQRRDQHSCFAASSQVWSVTVEDAKATGAPIIEPEQLAPLDKRTKADAPREITFDVGGEHHEFTAKPPHLHLGSKDEAKTLFGRDAEAAAAQLVADETTERGWGSRNSFVLDLGRDAAKLARDAAGVLRGAAAAVARSIHATAKIRSLRVFASTTGPSSMGPAMGFHVDDFQGGLCRSVHVSRDGPDSCVEFGITAFNWHNKPLLNDTFIGGVNVGGLLSYAKALIGAGETYLLNREGAGDAVLFFLKLNVDGVDVCVPFKRVHAVPRVHTTRHAIITTYSCLAEDLDDKTVYDSLAAMAQPLRPRDAPGPAFAPPPVSVDDDVLYVCREHCDDCEKRTPSVFVPRHGAGATLCAACVAAKNVLDEYQRCLPDKCAECYGGCAKFRDASGRQLCGECCDGRAGYYPKFVGDRCLIEGCGLKKAYVRMNAIGGGGFCWKCVPDKVEWRNQFSTDPDGTAKAPRQRTFNDDDLTDVDIRRLLGGKPALDDFMSRAAAGEFSIVPKVLQTVSKRQYHRHVPYLLVKDMEGEEKADEWNGRSYEFRWKHLSALLHAKFNGKNPHKDAQRLKKRAAKAPAKAPAPKKTKASPPKTGLAALTVAQLKAKCAAQKLKVGGTKGVLISRLEDAERGVYDWAPRRNAVLAPVASVRRSARGRAATASGAETGGAPVQSATASPPAATLPEPVQDSPPVFAMESDPSTGDDSTPAEVAPPEDDAFESMSVPGDDCADAPSSDDGAVPMSDDDDAAPAPPDAAPAPPYDESGSEDGDHALAPPTGGLDAAVLPIPGAFAECPGCVAGDLAQGEGVGHDDPVYGCLHRRAAYP